MRKDTLTLLTFASSCCLGHIVSSLVIVMNYDCNRARFYIRNISHLDSCLCTVLTTTHSPVVVVAVVAVT